MHGEREEQMEGWWDPGRSGGTETLWGGLRESPQGTRGCRVRSQLSPLLSDPELKLGTAHNSACSESLQERGEREGFAWRLRAGGQDVARGRYFFVPLKIPRVGEWCGPKAPARQPAECTPGRFGFRGAEPLSPRYFCCSAQSGVPS